MVLEAVKSKIKTLEDPSSGEGLIPGVQVAVFSCICTRRNEQGYLSSSFNKGTDPFLHSGFMLMNLLPPKGPISQYYLLELQYVNLGDTQTFSLEQGVLSSLNDTADL